MKKIIIIICLLVAVGAGGYWSFLKNKPELLINKNSIVLDNKPVEKQNTTTKDDNLVSNPKDVYFAYRAELSQAKNPTDIKNIISKYSPQKKYQELLNQLSGASTDYQNSIFELIKNASVGIINITFISQEIADSKATFKMSAYDSNDQRNTNGTLVMIKENGNWKIDSEEWKSVPIK